MKKSKKITNEDLMKQLEELKKKIDAQPVPVIIPQLPVVVYPGHTHCTCQWCHPHYNQPYYQTFPNYTVTSGGTNNMIGGYTYPSI